MDAEICSHEISSSQELYITTPQSFAGQFGFPVQTRAQTIELHEAFSAGGTGLSRIH